MNLLGAITGLANNILDRVLPDKLDGPERAEAVLKIQQMIAEHDTATTNAQRDVIVAELEQGDKYTKRARPTIVYGGLIAIGINHVLIPFVNRIAEWVALAKGSDLTAFGNISPINLPAEFWYAWTGVCSVYAVGRSMEKRGARNAIVGFITGNKS